MSQLQKELPVLIIQTSTLVVSITCNLQIFIFFFNICYCIDRTILKKILHCHCCCSFHQQKFISTTGVQNKFRYLLSRKMSRLRFFSRPFDIDLSSPFSKLCEGVASEFDSPCLQCFLQFTVGPAKLIPAFAGRDSKLS